MKLDTLYKTAKTGAIQVFNIETINDTYTVTWGQVNGKQQSKTTTCTPKNVGRSNETTGIEQAELEAKAVWTKKQKANYSTSEDAPVMQKLPMKVNEYKKHLKKVKEVTFTSPKLNGVNCEYRINEDGELSLLSRGGEYYPIPQHQVEDAIDLLTALNTNSINGEMYCHGQHLQDIMAATKKHNELTPRLKFHVFDFPEVEGTYQERCSKMYAINNSGLHDTPSFPFVPVWVADSPEEIEDQYEQVMEAGYEGLIIRNPDGLYEYNTRSLDVFKYKKTLDGEFKSFDYKLDKNNHPVFNCLVDATLPISKENSFEVKLKGTAEERAAMGVIAKSLIGTYIKVAYETLSKVGKPLKPVGVHFRKVDAEGEALE